MISGIDLISRERWEQLTKHNRTVIKDVAENSKPTGPFNMLPLMIGVANCARIVGGLPWPEDWNKDVCEKINNKTYKERLIIAGALIAAEIDRIQFLEEEYD